MGIYVHGKKGLRLGYGGFMSYRRWIMQVLDLIELYEKWVGLGVHFLNPGLDDEEFKYFEGELGKYPQLFDFMYMPDCDGKLTPKQCRVIANSLEKIGIKAKEQINFLDDNARKRWESQLINNDEIIDIMRYCQKRRVLFKT